MSFQSILNEEVLALKYLDVVTILLKYCGPKSGEPGETQAVIIDLIGTLGFFCVNNKGNQDLLTSEQKLVILRTVIKLPQNFQVVIYPTLVTVIWNNDQARSVLNAEFDVPVSFWTDKEETIQIDFYIASNWWTLYWYLQSLDEYRESQLAKRNKLIGLLK